MLPLIKQIEIFSGIRTVYFNYKYFSICTRELLGCLLGISGRRQEVSSVAVQFRKEVSQKVFLFMLFMKNIAILTFLSSSTSWLCKFPDVPFWTVRLLLWVEVQTVLVDPSVDTAVVGLTGWIIFKASTVKLPSILLLSTTSLSLASPSFEVTGVLKYSTKEIITLPSLWKITNDDKKSESALVH